MPQLGLTAHIVNTVTNARKNISAHYDISNAMFIGAFFALFQGLRSTPHRPGYRCVRGALAQALHPTDTFPDLQASSPRT